MFVPACCFQVPSTNCKCRSDGVRTYTVHGKICTAYARYECRLIISLEMAAVIERGSCTIWPGVHVWLNPWRLWVRIVRGSGKKIHRICHDSWYALRIRTVHTMGSWGSQAAKLPYWENDKCYFGEYPRD